MFVGVQVTGKQTESIVERALAVFLRWRNVRRPLACDFVT